MKESQSAHLERTAKHRVEEMKDMRNEHLKRIGGYVSVMRTQNARHIITPCLPTRSEGRNESVNSIETREWGKDN